MSKMVCPHNALFISNQKERTIDIYRTTWMNLKISTLNERRQTKKRVHIEWFHIYTIYKPRPHKLSYSDEKPTMVAWGNGGVWEGAGRKDYTKA